MGGVGGTVLPHKRASLLYLSDRIGKPMSENNDNDRIINLADVSSIYAFIYIHAPHYVPIL